MVTRDSTRASAALARPDVAEQLAEVLREGTGQNRDTDMLRILARRLSDNAPIVGADKEAAGQIIAEYARFIRVARAALKAYEEQA